MTVFAALLVAAAATAELSDVELWNQGVDYYRAGDVTNALRVLRPLTASGEYRTRAAEVVAKLEYERGERELAAVDAQLALRGAPDSERARRNFTRAVDGLKERREAEHVEQVMKAAEGKDPAQLLAAAAAESRRLFLASAAQSTNAPAVAVMNADAYAAKAQWLADVWLPVKEAICRGVTNQEDAATIQQQVDSARARTLKAAEELGDLNAEAYATLSGVESDFNRFHKLTVMPPLAMAEDLEAQSNAWLDVEAVNGRPWQREALDFTQVFRARFPEWARDYEQQAASNTNLPPFTAESQAKISALATELEKAQLECAERPLPPRQEEALRLISAILELLPPQSGGGGQNQQQDQQQNQQQNQQQQSNQPQDQQQSQDQQQDQQSQPDEQSDAEEREAAESEEQEMSEDEKEVEALLKKAQERNDEHEAEKKARMRKAPLPPNERDW